ncbi:MAG: glycogen debranching enzyme N-terminal domain-containing protein [Candidatus Bathyarchaeota archaeon]|nr:glycogen debranching enzyme N-terminal domain-containing protein [Candidatus Bathyarchaeota archaeon]
MKTPAIILTNESLSRFNDVINKEWLITNGLGSYASSTIPGINTRKYHGLLVAALNPPHNRTVCLSKLDEDIIVDKTTYRLGSNEFGNAMFPHGYKLIEQFSIAPYPTYKYDCGKVALSKTVFLPQKKNAVVINYHIFNSNTSDILVKVYPLLTCRYYHTVVDRKRAPLGFTQKSAAKEFQVDFERQRATMVCRSTDGEFRAGVNWVERLHYREEALRGEAEFDDLFQPGYFELQVPPKTGKEFAITCTVSSDRQEARAVLDSVGDTIKKITKTYTEELNQKLELMAKFYYDHTEAPMSDWLNWLLLAADSFLVQNSKGRKAVIAGYHWFEPWGRDTFISLPGLLLVTGKFNEAKDILQDFMRYLKGGVIPNFVADKTGEPVYNTVDGTLWYVNAVLQYLKYTGDFDFAKEQLWEKLQQIIESHQRGTMFGIRLDDDGLLMHGPRLTWMDAVVGEDIITPRAGKAVEIQALWYNALRTMELLANKFGEKNLAEQYALMASQARKSFNEEFWNAKKGCLFDVLEAKETDTSLRPNQIFAVSLDFTMLDKDRSMKVVDVVSRELATPYGLRTLSLDDPKFVGKCVGDRRSRDTAYHNGTIWPWLLGPYVTAFLKVNDYTSKARKYMLNTFVLPLFTIGIHQGGLGTISEIYDCDAPNLPRGCISQAWSVGEPLRAYVEDVLGIKPNHLREIALV